MYWTSEQMFREIEYFAFENLKKLHTEITGFCLRHKSAGELSGYGWSHIHCNSLEGKPSADIHQVSSLFSLYCLWLCAFSTATTTFTHPFFCFCSLQGNGIGESGAKVISDAIRTNAPGCVVDIWPRKEEGRTCSTEITAGRQQVLQE